MADSNISNLTAATTPLTGAELVPIVQSSTTVKTTILDIVGGIKKYAVTAVTSGIGSPYSITAAQSGTLFTNEGAGAEAYLILPTAAVGLSYIFYVQNANGLNVAASAGDTIRLYMDVTPAAGNLDSTDLGSIVSLLAINSTEWIATFTSGAWTVSE